MKIQFKNIILLLASATLLSSCLKKLELKIKPNSVTTANNLTELSASNDFDWETSALNSISITTLDNTNQAIPKVKVSLYSNYKSLNGKEIVSGFTDQQGEFKLDYRFAKALDSVVVRTDYIGFPTEVKVPISENQINFTFGGIPIDDETDTTSYPSFKSSAATPFTLNYLGKWNKDGKPRYLESTNDVISADFLADINNALPEYQPVPDYHPSYLWDIYEQNLNLIEDADVWITFVSEGAGYTNTLAFYTFDKNNPPQSIDDINEATVIFPNVSFKNSGGALRSGNKVYIGHFPAGTSLGWLLMTDAWDAASKSVGDGINNLFSHKDLNPESDPSLRQHVVLLKDASRDVFIISFEDLLRPGGDADFNDAVFYATVDPVSAVEPGFFPTFGVIDSDSDQDGVPDNFDDYPNDAEAAFNNYYPSEGNYASLAFEDLWPSKGDYDFNDLVIDYNFNTLTNIDNEVTKLEGDFVVRAIGAGFHNGFGFQIPGISSNQISSISGSALQNNYITLNANGTEAGQSSATVIVFDDAWNHGYGNTDPSKAYAAPTEVIHLDINLTNPIPLAEFGVAPFNPFIIVNKERGREIHMADYPPTDLADLSYFGQYNDDSNVETGKYYKTVDNLPWVINFPSQFNYPIEKSSIDKAYLNFIPWVESGGSQYQDWYSNQTGNHNPDFLY